MGLIRRAVPFAGFVALLALETFREMIGELFDPEPARDCRDARCEPYLDPNESRPGSYEASASPRHRIFTETLPPSGVNFKELLTRLMIT